VGESHLGSRQDVVVNRLETQLALLVEQQVLSAAQTADLLDAARADRQDGQSLTAEPAPGSTPKGSAVLEVLGYVGGALVLGAVIMLGSFFWDDLGSTGRKLVAVASFVVPGLGGAALIKGRARPELGRILLALACYAAGFAYLVVFEDQKFAAAAAVVVLTSALGAVLLRSGAFLVSGWSGAMLLVCAVVFNVIDDAVFTSPESNAVPVHLAVGFLLVGLALAASGLLLSRTLAWSLAGLSGWAASIVLQMDARGVALADRCDHCRCRPAHRLCADPPLRVRGDRLRDLAKHLAGLAVPDRRQCARRGHRLDRCGRCVDRLRGSALSTPAHLHDCIALIFSIAN
jgi:Predicted membrane protein (DUF2157)